MGCDVVKKFSTNMMLQGRGAAFPVELFLFIMLLRFTRLVLFRSCIKVLRM